jgi:hypothetical protein
MMLGAGIVAVSPSVIAGDRTLVWLKGLGNLKKFRPID